MLVSLFLLELDLMSLIYRTARARIQLMLVLETILYMSTMLTMAVIRRLMVVLGLTPCSSLPRVVRLRIH